MIKLKDKDIKEITVTDLKEALKQAERFIQYAHNDKIYENFDKQQRAYWQDLCEKLQKFTDENQLKL
jgi:hypothetical protein